MSAPKGPKNGTTDHCAHEGCTMLLRYKNGGWLHSIRNRSYDHEPTPVHYAPTTQDKGMHGFAAMAAMSAILNP